MTVKTANVMARVEPGVKEQAESIMSKLGVPASVVINMLYKQIIMTRSIPFSLSIPEALPTREGLDEAAFNAMMQRGLDQAQAGQSRPAAEVFKQLRQELR